MSTPPATPTPTPAERSPFSMVDAQARVSAELDRIAPVLDPLAGRFADAGHALALVGGPVRDALLGRPNVVHTPHNAGRTVDANREWAARLAVQFAPVRP